MKKKLSLSIFIMFCAITLSAQNLSLASFNVRNDSNKEDAEDGNAWSQRYPHIAEMIKYNEFYVFVYQ